MKNNTRSPISKELVERILRQHQGSFSLLVCECGAGSWLARCANCGEILVARSSITPCDCIAGLVL
jgi:hypothetical protein